MIEQGMSFFNKKWKNKELIFKFWQSYFSLERRIFFSEIDISNINDFVSNKNLIKSTIFKLHIA